MSPGDLAVPVVQAPMAGGPSTPALAAAVSGAGGLGFVAIAYLAPDAAAARIAEVRALTGAPFGVNLFCPPSGAAAPAAVDAYRRVVEPLAAAHGVALGAPRVDDDGWEAKLDLLVEHRPAVVSFAFGCPDGAVVERLRAAGIAVWVTVTDAREAALAAAAGADALVAQGAEAGGHRGSFEDRDDPPQPLDELLPAVRAAGGGAPVVAAGGLMDGGAIAAALGAGAAAAQLGTAFLLCPEAGTSPVHRAAVAGSAPTTITRAFTGRRARGVVNAWTEGIGRDAPSAYPEIHHLTAPLRAHGRARGEADLVSLWAGVGHARARPIPAAELVAELAREIAAA
ncbi:MAG: nitronate monooxygenase [Thermoleophilia bacterium]